MRDIFNQADAALDIFRSFEMILSDKADDNGEALRFVGEKLDSWRKITGRLAGPELPVIHSGFIISLENALIHGNNAVSDIRRFNIGADTHVSGAVGKMRELMEAVCRLLRSGKKMERLVMMRKNCAEIMKDLRVAFMEAEKNGSVPFIIKKQAVYRSLEEAGASIGRCCDLIPGIIMR